MTPTTTIEQLKTLQSNTLMYAFIVVAAALLITILTSALIPYKGGKDKSYIKRRIAYIVIGLLSCFGFFLYNELIVKASIMNVGFQSMFMRTNITCSSILLGIYVVLGIVLMLIFRHSKFGSILGKQKQS